jgi:hypothetical protein
VGAAGHDRLIDGSLSTRALIFAVAFSRSTPATAAPAPELPSLLATEMIAGTVSAVPAPSMKQSPSLRKEVRHVNSYLASQLVRERQRDMLAQAGRQRLARLAPASRRAERTERRMALRPRSELEQ